MRQEPPLHVPPGHPYSPIPSAADVEWALARVRHSGRTLPGIDLREDEQLALLASLQPLYDDLDLPETPRPGARFCLANTWFTYADAVAYALMLRHLRPSRVIEVGAGWSSALALDVAERFLPRMPAFTFVDPDPERLRGLLSVVDLGARLRAEPVQDVGLDLFRALRGGDILFVDSSHVSKAGSDVQFLVDEVLPILAPGVAVHFHDVFFPFEYPESWLRNGTAMNEAYVLRALLQASNRYRIVLFADLLVRFSRDWFARHMPLFLGGTFPTGGIWLAVG